MKIYGVLPDVTVDIPEVPTGLTEENDTTASSFTVSWTFSANANNWTVYIDGIPQPDVYNVPTATITGLPTPGASLSVQVQAHNSSGSSALSSPLIISLATNSPPIWIAELVENLSGTLNSQFSLELADVSLDIDSHPLTYAKISGEFPPGITLVDGILAGTPTLVGNYNFVLQTSDSFSTADVTVDFSIIDADTIAPTDPTDVVASSLGSTVTVTCTASTDASGIKEYRWFRDGVLRGATAVTEFEEVGVPNGTYTYSVQAIDASANENASAIVPAAPVVVNVAPAQPDVPQFTSLTPSTDSVQLNWVQGPNGPTPDQYILKFSLTSSGTYTEIANGNITSFNHTGLTPGVQHFYKLFAFLNGVAAPEPDEASAVTITSSSSIAWHPGHWWQTSRSGNKATQSYRFNTLYPQAFTTQAANAAFIGASVEVRWAEIETTQGNVQAGIDLIKNELEYLGDVSKVGTPRRLMIQLCYEKRQIEMADYEQLFPKYMGPVSGTNPNGLNAVYTWTSSDPGSPTKMTWDMTVPGAEAAFFNMLTALANGLRAQLTAEQYERLDGFRLHNETTAGAYNSAITTNVEFQAHFIRYAAKVRELFPDKMIWQVAPWGGVADGPQFHNDLLELDVLLAHGDTCPDGQSRDPAKRSLNKGQTTERVLMGTAANFDSTDIRIAPWFSVICSAVEGSEMGQEVYHTYTAERIVQYINEITRSPYLFWQTWEGKAGGDVDTDIAAVKAWVHANPTLQYNSPPGHYP